MAYTYDEFNDIHMDVLQEIGNIGCGNAATSLAVMLNQRVDITPPKIKFVGVDDIAEAVGGKETLSYGVLVPFSGDVEGMIMFVLDKQFAHMALNLLMGEEYNSSDDLDDMAISAIKEVGNILSASYVNSLAEMTGLRIDLLVPHVSIDMIEALLSVPIIKFGTIGDKVMFIEESFSSNNEVVPSHMLLFAEIESLNLILGKLGLM